MTTHKLTAEVINAAIEGFEVQKSRIEAQVAELRQLLNGTGADLKSTPTGSKKRTMSAAGRKAISEAQRKRWAAARGKESSMIAEPSKPKRKLSKAGRAAIVAALKKRWAAKKAVS